MLPLTVAKLHKVREVNRLDANREKEGERKRKREREREKENDRTS